MPFDLDNYWGSEKLSVTLKSIQYELAAIRELLEVINGTLKMIAEEMEKEENRP